MHHAASRQQGNHLQGAALSQMLLVVMGSEDQPERSLDRDEALAELTRRYFTSRGPATIKDYSRWSSLTLADCKRGLAMLDSELEHEVVEDREYWFAPASPPPKPSSREIDLVQVYDECVMSYSESRDALAVWVPNQETAYMHAILLDGQLIGHWKRVKRRTAIEIETFFYRPLNGVETKALHKAVNRYSRFLAKPAVLV